MIQFRVLRLDLAMKMLAVAGCAGCGGGSTASPDAGPDGGGPPLIVEPVIPLAECDVVFDRVYEIPGTTSARAWSVVELPSGHFVVAGEATPEEPTTSWDVDGFLMEVDGNGEMVWAKTYSGETEGDDYNDNDRLFNVFHLEDELIGIGHTEQNGQQGAWFLKTDAVGEIESQYLLPVDYLNGTCYQVEEDLFHFGGGKDGNVVIGTVDADGNYSELYQESSGLEHELSSSYMAMSSGEYVFWGYTDVEVDGTNFEPNENIYQYPEISILSPAFELKGWILLDPGYSGIFTAAAESSDGSILAGGSLLFDDQRWGGYLSKISTEGEIILHRLWWLPDQGNVFSSNALVKHGDGYLWASSTGGYGAYEGYLAKLNDDGEILWHYVMGPGVENYFTDVVSGSDEAVFAVGFSDIDGDYVESTNRNQVWFVKIEPNSECY